MEAFVKDSHFSKMNNFPTQILRDFSADKDAVNLAKDNYSNKITPLPYQHQLRRITHLFQQQTSWSCWIWSISDSHRISVTTKVSINFSTIAMLKDISDKVNVATAAIPPNRLFTSTIQDSCFSLS